MAIGAAQELFEKPDAAAGAGRAGLPAYRGERTAQQAGRVPVGADQRLDDALAPAALRNEWLIDMVGEVSRDQPVPIRQVHLVILANAEALFLLGADHVARDVAQQSPIEQL